MRSAPARLLPAVAVALAGCGGMPAELAFEGAALERATEWSQGGLTSAVYVPPGETLPGASLQVGFIVSETHATGEELMSWISEQYHSSSIGRPHVDHYYEEVSVDEACRIGAASVPGGARLFITLQVCRHAGGLTGCAEADERLSHEVVTPCLHEGDSCFDEVCYQRWQSRIESLEPLLMAFLGEP